MAIDLESLYASAECISRQLSPLTANLVVADTRKTEKTICLTVTPSLKKYGISRRTRLFEVIQAVKEINVKRKKATPSHQLVEESYDEHELTAHPELTMTYITAPPHMAFYLEQGTRIYDIYLKYISVENIHVYSIDEVFLDVAGYLEAYQTTPRQLTKRIVTDILSTTGVTAVAGIGTNLHLYRIAMGIVAKHIPADSGGVRIAQLNEIRYRRLLWNHRPLTDFWRIRKGYAKKLGQIGPYTMGDVARYSLGTARDAYNEGCLCQLFGVNAELLIDHAWGYEPCAMADIEAYQPENTNIGTRQVLSCSYDTEKIRLVIKEALDLLALSLVNKGQVYDQIMLTVGYDIENPETAAPYIKTVTTDRYGRIIPGHTHGTANLRRQAASPQWMVKEVMELFDRIINPRLTVRRIDISANHVVDEKQIQQKTEAEQLDLFVDHDALRQQEEKERTQLDKEKALQQATLQIGKKHGKNAVLEGMNPEEDTNTVRRDETIGGHKA